MYGSATLPSVSTAHLRWYARTITAEIEAIKLLGIEPMRGGWRLYWVAGGRVRSRLAASEKRNAGLRGLLGAADEDLVEATAAKLEQLAWLSQRVKRTEQQLADPDRRPIACGRRACG